MVGGKYNTCFLSGARSREGQKLQKRYVDVRQSDQLRVTKLIEYWLIHLEYGCEMCQLLYIVIELSDVRIYYN